jgi:tetratricopeptide (TPR) repeat protein
MRAAVILVLMAALAGCASGPEPVDPVSGLRLGGDAPFDLAEDQDLELLRADFAAQADDEAGRPAQRRRLADEYARRLAYALAHGQHESGHAALRSLLSLWNAADLRHADRVAPEIARYRAVLSRARDTYARAGRDREAAAALSALILADPEHADGHRAELDEIFAYADELAVAGEGAGAQRARPIEILERLVEFHPAPWVVDRLVDLYLGRQRAVDSGFRRSRTDLDVIRAHGDGVLRTAWHVTRVLARGGRIGRAGEAIEALVGIGDDRELRERVRRALAPGATAADWVLLAARFHSSDPARGDRGAALAIAREAARRFPRAPAAHLAAAEAARQMAEPALAIRYYESGLALDPEHADATGELGRLYLLRISTLALSDRPAAAGRFVAAFGRFHAAATAALGQAVEPDMADAEAAFGRGLVSLGQLDQARRQLERSLARRPTLEALESLGTMALKKDRFEQAIDLFERALARRESEVLARYQQCRIMRFLAEAYEGAGRRQVAASRYRAALVAWSRLMDRSRASGRPGLPAPLAAEGLVEQGKILWQLGERETALAAFDAAVDVDPNGASSHADLIAFLIVRGEYVRALDAYHRALGSPEIGDYFKVYMSLWVLAEARRRRLPADPVARDFVAARDGSLWYDDLARYATGRLRQEALKTRATTRARRAELLYYTAVLGSDIHRDAAAARRLLEGVVASDMVLFFEYDMARHWLRSGFGGGSIK